MENIITSTSTTTFLEEIKPKNPLALSRKPSEFTHAAVKDNSAASHRVRRHKVTPRWRCHKAKKIKVENNKPPEEEEEEKEDDKEEEEEEEEEDGEKPEVEQKIIALKRIVPGGESLGADKLFEETADYILALQFQVKALKFLTNFVEGSEMEKRKLGG